MHRPSFARLAHVVVAALCGAAACTDQPTATPPVQGQCFDDALRPASRPVESVAVTLVRPATTDEISSFLGGLFGAAARDGDRLQDHVVAGGVTLSVDEDARTADQLVASVSMTPSSSSDLPDPATRLIAQVPMSMQMGGVFIDAVDAATARTAEVVATGEVMSPWSLTYKARSAQGGGLTITVAHDAGATTLSVATSGPDTSLLPGKINTPARTGDPYETVGGTVWFQLGRDEFDFFSKRAYGVSAGRAQNFRDFHLAPHDWLRLTVTPQYALGLVDVGFEIVTTDGRRVDFARAPASYVAGEQFQQNVLRLADDMRAAEEVQAGSSTSFTAPFVYQDPNGGGVVYVIAQGTGGQLRIAYTVESPASFLQDVAYVPYLGEVDLSAAEEEASTCEPEEGVVRGRFLATFTASSTVRDSQDLKAALRGPVYGAVYRSSDVTITGPNDGSEPMFGFTFADVDVTDPAALRQYEMPEDLDFGDYQILGFMDIDGDADPANADPNTGDPVFIPIGGFKMDCTLKPVNVEFALLLPEGY